VSENELDQIELGHPFKHHSILDEEKFLAMCNTCITPLYTNRCKFHYSEISIIFLGYLIEKIYNINIEDLYQQYVLKKLHLNQSLFSRKRVPHLYCQDLSDKYDYPSVAILDHGYFCYSNGFFTTLNDMKTLLENLLHEPIFHIMTDMTYARAASNTIMNGLTIEIRRVNDDVIYGYEGLSFSGCNIWAYSTKHKQGFLTFTNDEEAAYPIIYDNWNYTVFDKAIDHSQQIYRNFLKNYPDDSATIEIPAKYQGQYHRVNLNETSLAMIFQVGNDFIVIRNPDEIKYDIMAVNGVYHIKGKDAVHGAKVGFVQSKQGNCYMYHDGTLYKKI
jgi:CubicO group peptidase (beta-lactamase class C family)